MKKRNLVFTLASLICCLWLALYVNATTKENNPNKITGLTTESGQQVSISNDLGVLNSESQPAGQDSLSLRSICDHLRGNLDQKNANASPDGAVKNHEPDPRIQQAKVAYERWRETGTATEEEKALFEEIWGSGDHGSNNALDNVSSTDSYGYRYVDNVAPDTATFNWLDLTTFGTQITSWSSADDDLVTVSMGGMSFPFYNQTYTSVHIGTNGNLQFTTTNIAHANSCIQYSPLGKAIMPFWDDLTVTTSGRGSVWYRYVTDRYFAVEWDSCSTVGNHGTVWCEAILYPSGKIKMQYKSVGTSTTPTIGIQGTSTGQGLQYYCNGTGVAPAANRAVWYYPPTPGSVELSVMDLSPCGRIQPNPERQVSLRVYNLGVNMSAPTMCYFNFDSGATIGSVSVNAIAGGAYEDVSFATPINVSAGSHFLKSYINAVNGDSNRTNDTTSCTVVGHYCDDFYMNGPGYISGNTTGEFDDCDYREGQDQVVRVDIPTTGRWTFSLCSSALPGWDTYMCLSDACCGGNLIRSNDDGSCGVSAQLSSMECNNLEAGTYYLDIEPYYTDGSGPWTLTLGQCCIDQQPGDILECEDEIQAPANDTTDCDGHYCDGYCSQEIQLGQTIYGKTFNYIGLQNDQRLDYDWYEFDFWVPETLCVWFASDAKLGVSLYHIEWGLPVYMTGGSSNTICDTVSYGYSVAQPGHYAIRVTPALWYGTPISHYRLKVTGSPAFTCHLEPQPGDIMECPELPDSMHVVSADCNEGCWPDTLRAQDIACGQTIFGIIHTISYGGSSWRDNDFFRFTVTEPDTVTWKAVAEPAFEIYLYKFVDCPSYSPQHVYRYTDQTCDSLSISAILEPGVYLVTVDPFYPSGVPISHYRAQLTCSPVYDCHVTPMTGDIIECAEVQDSTNAISDCDGGCFSTPNQSIDLQCGQSVYGTAFTYVGPGGELMRDLDFYRFTITTPGFVNWMVYSEPVLQAMISDTSICSSPSVLYMAQTTATCQSAIVSAFLQAGTYFAWAGPNAVAGVVPGHYRGTLMFTPCDTVQVNDVVIMKTGSNMELFWSSPVGFTGTYSVYSASTSAPYPDPAWTLLSWNIPPVAGPHATTYIDTTPIDASKFYLVVSYCSPR